MCWLFSLSYCNCHICTLCLPEMWPVNCIFTFSACLEVGSTQCKSCNTGEGLWKPTTVLPCPFLSAFGIFKYPKARWPLRQGSGSQYLTSLPVCPYTPGMVTALSAAMSISLFLSVSLPRLLIPKFAPWGIHVFGWPLANALIAWKNGGI